MRNALVAAAAGTLLSLTALPTAQAAQDSATGYDRAMLKALAASLGVSEDAAAGRLDRQAEQQDALAGLQRQGAKTDGAFFDASGRLVVNAADAKAQQRIEKAGLTARSAEHGRAALERVKTELDGLALKKTPEGVTSWSVDLALDQVVVTVHDAAGAPAEAFIEAARSHGDAVRVVRDAPELSTQAVVTPGDEMTFDGFLCSVGYGARDSSGKQVMVTAGHCIENLPVLEYEGQRFAQGTDTRFALGSDSVDMGVATLDEGSSIATEVGTWGHAGKIAVEGSERAPVGADICKSGRTTQWTCGKVESYDVSVTYTDPNGGPETVVTGLGSSSVCTEGGDSGGAYISGTQAQGMTSGGPSSQSCDGGVNAPGSSYFQPLDDALAHYGLTLNT
ncbi:alpha-lytic protease prodomain-containing protein [Streptomyces sp. NPDC007929]|uniref:S1 family peptidase n=1 Tax=unclassified Streptomyces TaxID=2593676 RepID=UPI0036E5C865